MLGCAAAAPSGDAPKLLHFVCVFSFLLTVLFVCLCVHTWNVYRFPLLEAGSAVHFFMVPFWSRGFVLVSVLGCAAAVPSGDASQLLQFMCR